MKPANPSHHEAQHPTIVAVGTALSDRVVTQEQVSQALREVWEADPTVERGRIQRIAELHRSVGVEQRHFVLPLDEYRKLGSFAERNTLWQEHALRLSEQAVRQALARAGLQPTDVDQLTFMSVTGIAAPSLDARLMNRLKMRPDVRRMPVFGLGCVAGAAGIVRADDYLRAHPTHLALLVSAELCSLTFQHDDHALSNVIATGLFGDGAAAVIMAGAQWRPPAAPSSNRAIALPAPERASVAPLRPRIIATRSVFYPDTEQAMGWEIVDTGFRVVLSPEVPALVRDHFPRDVDALLAQVACTRRDVRHWLMHTGGPKVLEAIESSLGLDPHALGRSWASLARIGNLSSASVLFVLNDVFAELASQSSSAPDSPRSLHPSQPASLRRPPTPAPGDYGVLAAMGPGFCAELVLLRW